MFSKLILAAAVAIPLGVLGLSASAMAAHSPASHSRIVRLHSEDRAACSANDNGTGLMSDCDEQGDHTVPLHQHDNNTHNSNMNAHSSHAGRR